MTIIPAYGRDYKSQKEAKEAWDEGKDFQIKDMFSKHNGSYVNKPDAETYGLSGQMISIRFKKLTQVCMVKV